MYFMYLFVNCYKLVITKTRTELHIKVLYMVYMTIYISIISIKVP